MRATVGLIVVAMVSTALLFVVFHSRGAGMDACHQEGFSEPGTLSWWPPGARCIGGLPAFESVILNNDFVACSLIIFGVAIGVGRVVDARLAKR